jgi:outer membrane protein TolC
VREAERNLAAQTAQIGVAAAARYPDLTLSGSIGLEALAIGDLYTAGARTAQGLVKAGFTIFDGGRIRQAIAVRTAMQEEALAAYEAAVLAALKEVEDALTAYANDQSRRRALQEAAAAGESAFRLARDRYASGLIDFETVLSTQRSLLIVQNTLAASQADATSDLIRLYKALGGGWTPSAKGADARTTTTQ